MLLVTCYSLNCLHISSVLKVKLTVVVLYCNVSACPETGPKYNSSNGISEFGGIKVVQLNMGDQEDCLTICKYKHKGVSTFEFSWAGRCLSKKGFYKSDIIILYRANRNNVH